MCNGKTEKFQLEHELFYLSYVFHFWGKIIMSWETHEQISNVLYWLQTNERVKLSKMNSILNVGHAIE